MAYSNNILPKSAAYYTLSNASIVGNELSLNSGGFAEIQVSAQMLPKLTPKMLVVAHPSVFSDSYANDGVQVTISIRTISGACIEYLIPITYDKSGVFNTELELPEEEYVLFTYRVSSKIPVTLYNWELCAEQAADLTTVIDGVEQSLPKLLYDYNTYAYAVAQKELTVGLISCYLLDSTDLQGHFTLSFFATERCNVHVRIKDNGTTELFSPQVYTVERGYASISIPHAYLHKTATDHAFSVTVQCTNGQLSIPVRGLLYTIDGGYLATRLLDAGIDIEDISIKQLSTDLNPSEIWAIGFEGNRIILKKRIYSTAQRENWEAIKDFGEGLCASVEFSGRWAYRTGSDRFTIETNDVPMVFIVDTSGSLKVYTGPTFDNIFELDTGVDSIGACQGFNSIYTDDNDQGIVIVYLKNGNAYYRHFAYNSTGTPSWYPAELLYDVGDAVFASVHRLPDYRIGICVEHATGTKWYITTRTYVSQGFKPEHAHVSTYPDYMIVTPLDVAMTSTVTSVASQNVIEPALYYNTFIMTFSGTLELINNKTLDDFIKTFKVTVNGTDINSLNNSIKSVDVYDDTIKVVLTNDVASPSTVSISFDYQYMFMRIYNGSLMYIHKAYSWTVDRPIVTHDLIQTTERTLPSISKAELGLTVRALGYPEYDMSDEVEIGSASIINAELGITVRALGYPSYEASNETTSVNVSNATTSVSVLQVGEVPI